MKTVTTNQPCCGEAPWNLHIWFPSGWRPQVVVSGSIKQRFGTNPEVQGRWGLTRWAEPLVWNVFTGFRELIVCRWVRGLRFQGVGVYQFMLPDLSNKQLLGVWELPEERNPFSQEFQYKYQFRKRANPSWQHVVTAELQKGITHKYDFKN